MAGETGDKFGHHARAVAIELYGEPNKQLSTQKELRFGNNGSVSVDLEKGTFYDHQESAGGGVLWAIGQMTGQRGAGAVEWMRNRGFDVEDDRPQRPAANTNTAAPARLDAAGNWLPPAVPDHGALTKAYDYRNADGELMYQVCRYDWTDVTNPKGHSKTFVQRRPDQSKKNGWAYKMAGVTWLPYRLPELLDDIRAGYPIFVVEGEKKVDMLREIGIPATCNHGGAGKFPEDLVPHFKGADLVILPDDDPQAKNRDGTPKFRPDGSPVFPGQDHANLIGRRLEGVARRIRILNIPDLPPKGGVDDWLPAGGSAEKLYDLVDSHARVFEAEPFQSKFGAVQWCDLDAPGPEYEHLVEDLLTENEVSMLLGESQSGKSFLAISVAMAVALGTEFFGRKTQKGLVIYQAGESALGVRNLRLKAYRKGHNITAKDVPFILLQDPLDLYSSDDPTEAFIDECLYWSRRSGEPLKLIVIDTLSKASFGANENDGKDMGLVLSRCDLIRRKTGAHVMLVHHLNAGGTKARGHTSLFANVENVITVRRLDDAHDDEGRDIREWTIAKQKDGEDGTKVKFVLHGVKIGEKPNGKPIFSCIVATPSSGAEKSPAAEEGLSINGFNAAMLRVVYQAIEKKGVQAPSSLALASGALAVTRKELAGALRHVVSDDDDEPIAPKDGETEDDAKRRHADALRKRIERAREYLFTKNVIGLSDEWVWLTGRPVKGFGLAPGLGDAETEARRKYSRSRGRDMTADPPIDNEPAAYVPMPWDEDDFK